MNNYFYPIYKEKDMIENRRIVIEKFIHGADIVTVLGTIVKKYDGFCTVKSDAGYQTCVNFIKNKP